MTEVIKVREQKTAKEFVRHSPSLSRVPTSAYGPRLLGRSFYLPNRGGEEHQGQNIQPSGENITQRTQEQQSRCISRLGKGRDQAGSFIAHTELLRQ